MSQYAKFLKCEQEKKDALPEFDDKDISCWINDTGGAYVNGKHQVACFYPKEWVKIHNYLVSIGFFDGIEDTIKYTMLPESQEKCG